MRGNFDVNESHYPITATYTGADDIALVNHLTGEILHREALVGAVGSPERDAQWARLLADASLRNAEHRRNNPAPAGVNTPLGQ